MTGSPIDVLSLVSATRVGGPGKSERALLDFQIGRRRLSSLFLRFDRVGVLGSIGRKLEVGFARQLLLLEPPAFKSGRGPLYICAECGDLGCGAVAVRVTRAEGVVVWSDFAEESYSGCGGVETFWPLPDFRFDWEPYRLLIAPFAATRKS